jgi:hypothetical protein
MLSQNQWNISSITRGLMVWMPDEAQEVWQLAGTQDLLK